MPKNGSDSTKLLGKYDHWLFLIILMSALLALALVHFKSPAGRSVTVTVDGKVFGSWPLDRDEEIVIESGSHFKNVLVIRDGEAMMTEADCPDKICVHHKPISRRGESIICLPHKLVVEISGEKTKRGNDGEGDTPFDVVVR